MNKTMKQNEQIHLFSFSFFFILFSHVCNEWTCFVFPQLGFALRGPYFFLQRARGLCPKTRISKIFRSATPGGSGAPLGSPSRSNAM